MISVIVPIYNAERYIKECIESVISQTYKNWELILVNDGSTDNSGALCDNISMIDTRIKVIHQENQGVTKARYNGFSASNGEYIYFVDADDTLRSNALEYMLALFQDDIDIVVSDYKCNVILNRLEYAKLLLKHDLLAVFMKMYRRSCLNEYVFETPEYFRCGEDFLMQLRILKNIKGKILCSTVSTYCYRNVADSVSHTFIPTMEYEIELMKQVNNIIKRLSVNEELLYAHFKFKTAYLGGMIGLKYPISYKAQWVTDIVEESKKYKLNLREKISILAVKCIICRYILIAEKKSKHCLRKYFKP